MKDFSKDGTDWIYPLKKRIIFGITAILTLMIVIMVFFIASKLRNSLVADSAAKTRELSNTINLSLKTLMLTRAPDMIQDAVENIGKNSPSVVKAFILDRSGRIVYSSDRDEIGKVLDKYRERSCHGCHQKKAAAPSDNTILVEENGSKVHRNVKVIYNEAPCYGCHAKADRINGKLIIDRSLKETYATIASVEAIIFGSGLVCIALLVPFLSRIMSTGVNKYIHEITDRHAELRLLYAMIERLSKTIDLEELKIIVFQIIRESLDADEIDMVFHKKYKDNRITAWSGVKGTISRKKIEREGPMWSAIERWIDGRLDKEEISEDRSQIYMPIIKNDTGLALIFIRKTGGGFDPALLGLVKVMSSHISVAFENALLYHLAITDELTALYTQRHFRTSMDRKISDYTKYGEKFSLLLMDIDDFKRVNDTFGHVAGDTLLKGIARSILISIRDSDMAFRYGGEEFAVVLPSTGMEDARNVAERIREEIAGYVFKEAAPDLHITISIGVSTCPGVASTARDLILTADQALYKAKHEGKNRVVVSEGL